MRLLLAWAICGTVQAQQCRGHYDCPKDEWCGQKIRDDFNQCQTGTCQSIFANIGQDGAYVCPYEEGRGDYNDGTTCTRDGQVYGQPALGCCGYGSMGCK